MKNRTRIIAQWDKSSVGGANAKCLQELTMEYIPRVGDSVLTEENNMPLKITMVVHNLITGTIDVIVNYNPNSPLSGFSYADAVDR